MTDENTSNNTNLETTAVQDEVTTKQESQEQVTTPKTYSEKEFKDAMAAVRARAEDKVLRKFEGVDVDRYKDLLQKEESEKLQKAKDKGEFEKILKEQAEKSAARINSLTGELAKIRVDGALINAASTMKAINPEQVSKLVKDQIKMSETGEVEIIDQKTGTTRYTDAGEPMKVEDLVNEFLTANPHFTSAGPAGAGSKSNTNTIGTKEVDIAKLDLMKAEDRAVYKQWRDTQKFKPI